MVGGDSASDGVPLLTRVLLVRASVRFDPSFPLDGVSCSPRSCHSPTTATTSSFARDGGVRPTLRVVAHYARGTAAGNAGPLRSATSTPRDDAAFFDTHAALHQALASMAADRLGEKVRLRQLQTHVAKTTVKLARVLTSTTAAATTAAGGGRGKEAAASPDPASLFADSLSQMSSPSTKASLYVTKQEDDNNGGSGSSHHGANRSDGLGDRGGVSGAAAHNAQVQGMLAAATATFAEDAAWRSLTTPHRPQLNPWCLTPIADEGCFLCVPTPAYVHWCELHCAQCCSKNNININNTSSGGGNSRAVGTAAPLSDTEPYAQGGGTMRYLDTLHYTSASAAGEAALHHGYAFLLDGAVFTGWDDNTSEDGPPSASTAAAGEKTPFRGDSGEMSVLLWCVLSDAPVFNFMRSVTMEAVAAMSYVAQRTYHETTSATASTRAASASATTMMGTGVPVDVYTGLLESALRDEVVLPIARELLQPGTAASRAVPGESFTVSLPLARGRQSGVAARPQTSSMSGTLPFRRPLDLLFPCADVPLSTLLLSFGEDALRVLQSLMLQEERIVVIGATPQHASACVVSLPALIAPLLWVSPLVPYLPPHTAAQTGFLYTLLSTPYEMQQQQQQSSSPVVSRPATTASGSATQSSQHMESAGFLLGSTAAIRPYLMFLSSFGIAEAGVGGGGGHRPRCGRAPRVWIADARSGAIGPCPTEPITPYFRVDRPLSTAEGSGGGGGAATTAAHNGKDSKDESCSGRSRSEQGGASAWTLAAHLDLRLAAPHVFASSGGGGGGGGVAQNPYVLYNAVRNTLRTAAEQNVMDAAPLDVLPPFQDELCDALRRVASAEKRRQFRAALEDVAQHRRARVDGLESLAARLRRGLRHALAASAAAAAAASATAGNSRGASGGIRASCVADTTYTDSDDDDGSDSDSGSDESSSSGSSSDVSDGEAMRRWDENASFHAVTQAVRPSSALGCADAYATAASSSSSSLSPSVFAVAQFPSLPVSEVLQVQTGLLAYVVGRIVGAYRRGLSASSSSAATHRGSRRRYIQAPVFLVPGLDQHYTLAETVVRTHLFRQFECTVLAAEAAGLRRTLSGEQLVASRVDSEHSGGRGGGGSDGRGVLRHINTLSMFALLLDRARLQYPDLYADHPSLDALGTVYASLVKHCFQHRPGTPAPPSVPPTIRVIAGGGPSTVSNSSGGGNGGGGGVSGSNSSGGGGGGFKNFLNKAAKAMKLHSSGGSGGGLGGGGGGWGGGGGGRRLPVVYVPASVACMTSFIVPPFSAQNVAPPSFPMLAPTPAGTTGYTTIHDVRAQERRHHHHQRGLRRHHHDENDNTGKKEKKKKKKKQSKRRGKHHGSELYAVIPSAPRRQQWARQQQHQQRSALDMDFTLDDCTTVVRNHHVPGGVSGSLSSSFSASTGAAVAAAAAARAAAAAGGGFPTNATNSTVNSNGSGAYSGGAGIDAEVLTALAQAGGARGGGGSEATRRVMAEASLSICHALPLDLVHQFDAYEHLLAPLCAPSTTASVSAEGKAEADELSGPVAFMRVGLCCPTCVNVWREGEARAIHTLQQQHEEERQQYRHPQQQQQAQRHSVPSPSPPLFGNTSSSPLPPMPAKTGSLSTPQEVQLWSTPPPTTPHPSRVVPDAFAVTPAVMEDTASSWGAFTSGAPQGYPVDAMMSLDYPTQSLPRPDRTVGGAATSTPFAASPVVSSTRMTGTPASAFAPSPPMPQMNAHQDVWDSWGVQAPVVENTPTTAAPPAVMVGNYPNAATPTAPAASSLSVNGSSVNWTTTATSTPPMMVTTRMAEGGRGEGVFPPRLPPPLPLPQATSSSSSVSMARPLAAPAPGDVMDELFAGLSSYNNGASGSGSAAVQQQQQQQQQQPRRQTLDDFF